MNSGGLLIKNMDSMYVYIPVSPGVPIESMYSDILKAICLNDHANYKINRDIIILLLNGRRVATGSDLARYYRPGMTNEIQWFTRQKGGIFMELINFILGLLKLVLHIPKFLLWLLALLLWIMKLTFFLAVYAIRYITKGGITGFVHLIVHDIFMLPVGAVMFYVRKFVNWIGRYTVQAIWGADNVPDSGDPSDRVIDPNGCDPGDKCYKTADGTIPFSVIMATVLCPPVGVFMEYGVLGWFNVLICALLTLAFYFPGLIYALLLLYC